MRVFHNFINVAADRPPRYDEKNAYPSQTPPLHVGRGTGPRHRSRYTKNVSCSLQVRRT